LTGRVRVVRRGRPEHGPLDPGDNLGDVDFSLGEPAYYGCAKADYLNQVIGEQKQRVLAEN